MGRVKVGLSIQYKLHPNKRVAEVNNYYPIAIERAGGLPVLIPVLENIDRKIVEDYIDSIDCLILSGGADIMPRLFGAEPHPTVTEIFSDRDEMELMLFECARAANKPVLGICRGMQLINVALGGTLIQDIPAQVPGAFGHVSESTVLDGYHGIQLEDGFLKEIFKSDNIFVNSQHHQAIDVLGKDLRVVAKSSDGIIEAVENSDKSIIATQFHPEALAYKRSEFLGIFKYLINRGK